MANNTPSQYLPYWAELKEKKALVLEVPAAYESRLRRAIIKMKDQDIAWKYTEAERGNVWYIQARKEVREGGNIRLHFSLKIRRYACAM